MGSGKWRFSGLFWGGKRRFSRRTGVVYPQISASTGDNHRGISPEWRPKIISRRGISPAIGDKKRNYCAPLSHSGDRPKSLIRALMSDTVDWLHMDHMGCLETKMHLSTLNTRATCWLLSTCEEMTRMEGQHRPSHMEEQREEGCVHNWRIDDHMDLEYACSGFLLTFWNSNAAWHGSVREEEQAVFFVGLCSQDVFQRS